MPQNHTNYDIKRNNKSSTIDVENLSIVHCEELISNLDSKSFYDRILRVKSILNATLGTKESTINPTLELTSNYSPEKVNSPKNININSEQNSTNDNKVKTSSLSTENEDILENHIKKKRKIL